MLNNFLKEVKAQKCQPGNHTLGENCKCTICGEEEHYFRNDACMNCGAVKEFEICNVSEQVQCDQCFGSGGDYNSPNNSYESYCSVCGGSGLVTRQVTRKREYIVYKGGK
jgi:hypothetical protein